MAAVARELPNTGYALEVDGRLKTGFETKEGAWTGTEELKKRFPMLRVKIYDAETKTTKEFQLPSSWNATHKQRRELMRPDLATDLQLAI